MSFLVLTKQNYLSIQIMVCLPKVLQRILFKCMKYHEKAYRMEEFSFPARPSCIRFLWCSTHNHNRNITDIPCDSAFLAYINISLTKRSPFWRFMEITHIHKCKQTEPSDVAEAEQFGKIDLRLNKFF